jgi:predicted N-acetyltransferase YhbS
MCLRPCVAGSRRYSPGPYGPVRNGTVLFDLIPLSAIPHDAVEALLDLAFGPGRQMRTAYRVRACLTPIDAMSFAVVEDDVLIGSIQCWPVQLDQDEGGATPMVMVGPVAVIPGRQGTGIGRALMAGAMAVDGPDAPLMLVGDPDYYGRFGFTAARTGGWRLPGPYEQHRLLARGAVPDMAGVIAPRAPIADGVTTPLSRHIPAR